MQRCQPLLMKTHWSMAGGGGGGGGGGREISQIEERRKKKKKEGGSLSIPPDLFFRMAMRVSTGEFRCNLDT